jgi:gas vesicle protein
MSNRNAVGLALLAGVAIGAGIGILMAPEKGTKTREKLKEGYDDAKKGLKDKYDAVKNKIASQDAEGAFENIVTDLDGKSADVITFLEQKLAALKKEVAKY